jgi:hypothetical protein
MGLGDGSRLSVVCFGFIFDVPYIYVTFVIYFSPLKKILNIDFISSYCI